MRPHNYELGNTPFKLVENLTLLKTDKCILTAFKDTLVLPLTLNEEALGFFMHGTGKLVIDTIIETSKGAVGKPIEKKLTEPFIMVGNVEEFKNKMIEADLPGLGVFGYQNPGAFHRKAVETCDRILKEKVDRRITNGERKRIFFLSSDEGHYDTLVSREGRELIYISGEKIYLFGDDKSVISRPNEVLLSKGGRRIIIAHNNVLIEKEEPKL